jgi:nitroreductase
MNEVLQTIYERRAVRKFKDRKVLPSIVEEIINAGRMAPSAINKQPWSFYILTDRTRIMAFSKEIRKQFGKQVKKISIKEIIKAIAHFSHIKEGIKFLIEDDMIFHGAPVVIFITSPKDNEWAKLDVGMCAQNMMLAARSLGLESCPVGLAKFVEQTKIYSQMNVPKTDQVDLALIFGYGDESPEPKERKKENSFYI